MAGRRPGDPPRFMQICDTFGNLFILNLTFFICCLPIITIGASINALNTILLKMLQEKDGKIFKGFLQEFKKGFFKSTCIWMVYIVNALLIYSEFLVLKQGGSEAVRTAMVVLMILGAVFILSTLPYVFWMNARYENTIKMMFINSFLLFFKRFFTWIKLVIIWAGPISLMVFFYSVLVKFWFVWIVFLTSFLAYVSGMFMMREFKIIEDAMKKAAENEAEDNTNLETAEITESTAEISESKEE